MTGDIHRLQRSPIRQATTVQASRTHTFDTFVDRIGEWWPLQPYSLGGDQVTRVTFERHLDGRVYETWADGTERTWGRLVSWDPPAGFAMTWDALPASTEVELRFIELGPNVTRVELEHRGWDQLTREQIENATTAEGGYETGWKLILAALTRIAADTDDRTAPPTDAS